MGCARKSFCVCLLPFILYMMYVVMMLVAVSYLSSELKLDDVCSSALDDSLRVVTDTIIDVNGIKLNVWEGGNPNGKLVVFLHGFPVTGLISWVNQFPYFDEHTDYHFIAPDTRGVNASQGGDVFFSNSVRAAEDIVALIKYYGYEKAHIVGHDWGASISWTVANNFPEVVDKLVILNVPNNHGFVKALTNTAQSLRSWYMFFFQLPVLPEKIFLKYLGKAFSNGTITCQKEYDMLMESWQRSNINSINYYRAIPKRLDTKKIDIIPETLIIWGTEDVALAKENAEYSLEVCRKARVEYLEVGHWVQFSAPSQVNRLITNFLNE